MKMSLSCPTANAAVHYIDHLLFPDDQPEIGTQTHGVHEAVPSQCSKRRMVRRR